MKLVRSLFLGILFLLALLPSAWAIGPDKGEVKLIVDSRYVERLKAALDLSDSDSKDGEIYFFDTKSLKLFNGGTILRARLKNSGKLETTVKFRPVDPDSIHEDWWDEEGFKLEKDASGNTGDGVTAASLTRDQNGWELAATLKEGRDLDKLFDGDQEQLLAELTQVEFDWEDLSAFGRIKFRKWEVSLGRGLKVDIERWRLPSGREFWEVSTRTRVANMANTRRRIIAALKEKGVRVLLGGPSKTKMTLDELVATSCVRKLAGD